jgi:hypothetical protein
MRGALGFAIANPFDPAEVDLAGEFEAPDGQHYRMPGFYTRDYTRSLVGGYEKLAEDGTPYWAVRFTPTQPGTWRWRWVVTTPGFTASTDWRDVAVGAALPGAHGFLHPSPLDPRWLRYDDGTPYLAIGENLAWADGRGTYAYDDWVGKLASQGVNYARLWMPSWGFGLEWSDTPLGDYTNRLDRAWQLDHVMGLFEQAGIAAMLNLQNHGPFSLDTNTQWADNPYNAANGGPLAAPGELWTDETARELFRRRLRYVVARWGYSPAIVVWELWNEVNFVPGFQGQAALDWHAEMADWLRSLDPHGRMVSTSLSTPLANPLHTGPHNDLVQTHQYMWPLWIDVAETLALLSSTVRQPGRPHIVSEYGVDFRGPGETRAEDPEAVGFHDGLWGPLLSGSVGTGMSWWWDNVIDPDDLYPHFGAIAAFTAGVAFDEQQFAVEQPAAAAPGRTLDAYALVGPDVALVWIKNKLHQWWPPLTALDPTDVLGASLELPTLAEGTWRARWFDTATGAVLHDDPIVSGPTGTTLTVPTFARDTALRLERQP